MRNMLEFISRLDYVAGTRVTKGKGKGKGRPRIGHKGHSGSNRIALFFL